MFFSCSKNISTQNGFYNLSLHKKKFEELNGWNEADLFSAKPAILKSCNKIAEHSKEMQFIRFANLNIDSNEYQTLCSRINKSKNNQELKSSIEKHFYPVLLKSNFSEKAHFTAYVDLEVEGSLIKEDANYVPIYSMPFKRGKSHLLPTRQTIDNTNIFKEQVLAYIKDPVQAYFLHIQGSGRLKLTDGTFRLLSYDGDNGRSYTSVGKVLVEKGYIKKENVSMKSIQKWMYNNPKESQKIRNMNERYIFFKFRKGHEAIGASGVELTSFHSAAVDHTFLPFHTFLWVGNLFDKQSIKRGGLFLSHDKGSAIKGPLRVDLYLGAGKEAEKIAGNLSLKSKLWALIPKNTKLK